MKISVCMATYNGEKYIFEQINSILSQLNSNDELIISDDNSTDNTINVIKYFQDNRIKLFINQKRIGVISNFENALIKASGDYIFLSDQDDVWLPNKINIMIDYLQTYDLVIANVILVNSSLSIIKKKFWENQKVIGCFFNNLYKNPYLGCSMAFRNEILKYTLPFPKNIPMHDIWIGLCTQIFSKKCFYINQPLMYYRRHGNNLSPTGENSSFSLIKKITYRLQVLYCLIFRKIKFYIHNISH